MAEELEQNKEHGISVKTETNEFYLQGRPCELSAFSFVPTKREDPPERTVFNSLKPVGETKKFKSYSQHLCCHVSNFTHDYLLKLITVFMIGINI